MQSRLWNIDLFKTKTNINQYLLFKSKVSTQEGKRNRNAKPVDQKSRNRVSQNVSDIVNVPNVRRGLFPLG